MSPEKLGERLVRFEPLLISGVPSPLTFLPRLSERVAGKVWIKRDDGIGWGGGGNKARPLSFILPGIVNAGKKRIVTFGGLQSNHARMTAALCANLGLTAHLFYFERRPARLMGNLLWCQLLGAKLHFVPIGSGGTATMRLKTTIQLVRWAAWLRLGVRRMRQAYFMPVGGHTPLGGLGYVAAALELHRQIGEAGLDAGKTVIVVPAGTGGTLAGLAAGFSLLNAPIRVVGIDIGKLWQDFTRSTAHFAAEICQLLGKRLSFSETDFPLIEGRFAGAGYAIPHESMWKATKLLAQSEGIVLDPVYSGKAFAGMLALLKEGYFAADDTLIFWHTGGLPGLWAYEEAYGEL